MTAHRDTGADCVEIDLGRFPVIARHWFGIEPAWEHIGEVTTRIVNRLASRCAVDDDDQDAAA